MSLSVIPLSQHCRGSVQSSPPPGRHDSVLLVPVPPISSLLELLQDGGDVDEGGLVASLPSLAVSIRGVLITVVSSLLPCEELPRAKSVM